MSAAQLEFDEGERRLGVVIGSVETDVEGVHEGTVKVGMLGMLVAQSSIHVLDDCQLW